MNEKTLKALLLILFFLATKKESTGQTNSDPKRYDVVISEIMAKPAPEVGLPAVEYLELHNRLPHSVELRDWHLKLGNTVKKLPDFSLDSCGYAILIAQKHLDDFSPYCNRIVTLSSLSITDGGQSLTLTNPDGDVIHHVSFKKTWHSEVIKQEGGWSLEMIDTQRPCAGRWNWDSSTDPSGGTPGRKNSICKILYDNTLPSISGVSLLDSTTLRVHLTMAVDVSATSDLALFHITPSLNLLRINEVPPDFTALDLRFAEPVGTSTTYMLHMEGTVQDCGGNLLPIHDGAPFGTTRPPTMNDLVINEVLTNPLDGENADYLEIFNRSDNIIDLRDVKVGYGGDTLPLKAVTAVSRGWQIHPKGYAVLCRQREVTLNQYICKDERCLIDCDSLPDFVISQGIIHLTDRSLRCVDRLAYTEKMHYPKLLTTKGVALERLYADRPTQDENNWRSAAESAGYGTPGYLNSQAGLAETDAGITVFPDVFSPDNDGFEDYAEIVCKFTEEENRVSIILYNNRGHPVKHLANNVLCGREAHFRWDGTDNRDQPAPAGIYVALVEYWNLRTQKTARRRMAVSIYR